MVSRTGPTSRPGTAAGPGTHIRPLEPEHLPWVLALTNSEGWDYRAEDLERLRGLEPEGSLVAFDGQDRPLGYLTALAFPPLGLIGNVVTIPESRGRGVATWLMEAALAHLQARGCCTQRLFAYTHTLAFHHRFGFRAAGVNLTLQGEVLEQDAASGTRPFEGSDLERLVALDQALVGYQRGPLLAALLHAYAHQAWVSHDEDGKLDGYLIISGVPGPDSQVAYEVGPWVVAPGCGNWQALLVSALAGLEPGARLELSTAADNQRVLDLCASLGIGPCYSTIDMLRGEPWQPPEQNVLARAGLVKG